MTSEPGYLKKEDYAEPRCVLCGEPYGKTPEVRAIPQQRVIAKMDEYMGRRDYAGAERHLLYWLEEARLGRDLRGELLLRNELTGHYRKTGNREKALENGRQALRLLDLLEYAGTISAGTTYTNFATACNAFGENARALELFEKARAVYESVPRTDPALLGGLYNNMALTCVSLDRFAEASELYQKALDAMRQVPGGELEQAITCLNMADALEKEYGMEAAESRIFDLLDTAYSLLDGAVRRTEAADGTAGPYIPAGPEVPWDEGYYAFVCEKCAPSFSYYGYFLAAEELSRRAEEIYGRRASDD